MVISLLAYLLTFSGQFYFRRNYFRVTTSTKQLLFRNRYFYFRAAAFLRISVFGTVISSQQLFFSEYLLFGAKLLPSSYFLRIGIFLGQLLFETAAFLAQVLLRKRYLQKSSFFKAGTSSAHHQHFQKSYILNFPHYLLFLGAAFSEELLFHSYASSPHLDLLFISQ